MDRGTVANSAKSTYWLTRRHPHQSVFHIALEQDQLTRSLTRLMPFGRIRYATVVIIFASETESCEGIGGLRAPLPVSLGEMAAVASSPLSFAAMGTHGARKRTPNVDHRS